MDNGNKNEYDKRRFHPRKQKRMVRSIQICLDENNYELIDMCKVEKEEVVVVLEKKKKFVTNSMIWATEQPPQSPAESSSRENQNIVKRLSLLVLGLSLSMTI